MPAATSPSPLRRLRGIAGGVLTAAAVALAAAVLLPALLGFQRYVITSGSMTGTYDRGSLVYDRVVPTTSLKVGDVITYAPPQGSGPAGLVTHRIHAITKHRDGRLVYRTKGDFNPSVDPWTFTLSNRTQAKVGILLYLSTRERMAEIIADEAIHRAVPAERWGDAMAALVAEVREGRAGDGMAAAVTAIGAILAETFPKTENDVNELPDRLIEL